MNEDTKKIRTFESLFNIKVGTDTTDHMDFICPECNMILIIENVSTAIGVFDGVHKDKCTNIRLRCLRCMGTGQRKFYWKW